MYVHSVCFPYERVFRLVNSVFDSEFFPPCRCSMRAEQAAGLQSANGVIEKDRRKKNFNREQSAMAHSLLWPACGLADVLLLLLLLSIFPF